MSSQGSPYARFRRALATGNGTIAWAAASELPRVELADALSLCLLLIPDQRRYRRAIVRWHGRLCGEVKDLTIEESNLVLAALQALPGVASGPAAEALAGICEARGLRAVAEALDGWRHD